MTSASLAWPHAQTIHDLLEHQAQRLPHKTALVYSEQSFTYAGCNHSANQLARHLRLRGVKRGSLVGVCLERNADLVVVLYAILKAGGAYVPLDPLYPKERLGHMVTDSGMSHLITTSAHAAVLPQHQAQIIDLHAEQAAISTQAPSDLPPEPGVSATTDDLAYVIYTSGSTGRAKGVAVPHRCALHFFAGMAQCCGFGEGEVTLSPNTISFDISVADVFLTLGVGATLVLAPQEAPLDGQLLAGLLARHPISHMLATPSTWRILLESGWEGSSRLRAVAAGEALPKALAQALLGLVRSVWNGYGPTEITVIATFYQVTDAALPIYIGKPIAHTHCYVLDAERKPVAPGESGELYIAGPGVAQGYLHRPELTAERFLPDPFLGQDGANAGRMYKTGDLARLSPHGELEFLGRSDEQVKIRGFRVELGDVEAALLEHPAAAQAVAVVHLSADADQSLAVYYTLKPGASISIGVYRAFLAERLPQYMLPNHFVPLTALPLTPNGKIDRLALPKPIGPAAVALPFSFEGPQGDASKALTKLWQDAFPAAAIDASSHFFALGGTSLLAVRLCNRLRLEAHITIPVLQIFQHPALGDLIAWYNARAAALHGTLAPSQPSGAPLSTAPKRRPHRPNEMKIAVIGMALRCPGAENIGEFWQNLVHGIDAITHFAPGGLDPSVPASDAASSNYVYARGILKDGEGFDAAFFGINDREAEVLDPQHRQFLEMAWTALEHAGYQPGEPDLRIGVYGGTGTNTYLTEVVHKSPGLVDRVGAFQVMVANEKDYLTTRVMHRLNLTGPAVTVQTACSTSLVAVHMAVQALRLGDCDMALAGGSSSTSPLRSGYFYEEGAMLSPDGHTRTFDAAAGGTVFSDGAGAVLLKRYSDAVEDGDEIYGVILGTALNNDGAHKASFSAPSVAGQAEVIAQALADAGVDAASLSYVEAHGTATPLGDPIEIAALTQAFRQTTAKRGYCAIGSVKSNIGHLTAAAGVAGLIKTCLSLVHRHLPPTLHYQAPNPHIDFAASPFRVNDRLQPWERGPDGPRRAGISSFGVGGTNAHVIIEEPPQRPAADGGLRDTHLLVYSAQSERSLASKRQELGAYMLQLGQNGGASELQNAAYTLLVGRKALPYRDYLVATSAVAAAAQCKDAPAHPSRVPATTLRLALLFPGQGSQHRAMGRSLYAKDGVFRRTLSDCAAALKKQTKLDLISALFSTDNADSSASLTPTAVAQPALFAVSYALAKLWRSLGVQPAVLLGHSVGEYTAACIAGVLGWEEALFLVAERGRLMQEMPPGAMLSVRLPSRDLLPLLPPSLVIAAYNSPGVQVVAGPEAELMAFAATLTAQGTASRRVIASHAFHSPMMQEAADRFGTALAKVRLQPPQLPIISTLTGQLLSAAEATSADYWAQQLRSAVAFAPAIQTLCNGYADQLSSTHTALLEVGPGEVLTKLVRQQVGANERAYCVSSLGSSRGEGEEHALLCALGELWRAGLKLAPEALYDGLNPRRIALPTYPFERLRHWPVVPAAAAEPAPPSPMYTAPVTPTASAASTEYVAPAAATSLTASAPEPSTVASRHEQLVGEVMALLSEASGLSLELERSKASFLELGLDSLFLTQLSLRLRKIYGVRISFRQLLDDYATPDHLAAFLARQATTPEPLQEPSTPATAPTPVPAAAPTPAAPTEAAAPAPTAAPRSTPPASPQPLPVRTAEGLDAVIAQQLQVMMKQLELLGAKPSDAAFPGRLRMTQAAPAPAATEPPVQAPPSANQAGMPTPFSRVADLPPRPTPSTISMPKPLPTPPPSGAPRRASTPQPTPQPPPQLAGVYDARLPPQPGARLGRDAQGYPAWYVANADQPGAYTKIG